MKTKARLLFYFLLFSTAGHFSAAATLQLMGLVTAKPFHLQTGSNELVPNRDSNFRVFIAESNSRQQMPGENSWKEIKSPKKLSSSCFVKIQAP